MSDRPGPALDERQPLLEARVYDVENPAPKDIESVKERSWCQRGWYSTWAVLGIVVVVLCVKAAIDADDAKFDAGRALKDAFGGGLVGAVAMVLEVVTLMPLYTVMNYQFRYGTTMTQAFKTLYLTGGCTRYYSGFPPALLSGPVSRFLEAAANVGILALLQTNGLLKHLPAFAKTAFASLLVACLRMLLTPGDTLKTIMQTEGRAALPALRAKMKIYGAGALWYGAFANAAATLVGYFPWLVTYNYLDKALPLPATAFEQLLRQAFVSFCALLVFDTVSNSIRVVKTYRQVHASRVGYLDAARAVIAADGVCGLLCRGLKTKILANGVQSIVFTVLWKLFLQLWTDNPQ